MSGRPKLRRVTRFFPSCSEEPSSTSSIDNLLSEQELPDANGLARSWKTILTLVITLTFLLFGFRHHEWFKETEFPQKSKQLHAMIAEYSSRLHHYQARFRMPKEQLEPLK